MFAELRTTAAYLLALVALVVRYRRGTEIIRRQLLWLLLALIVVIVALLPWGLVAGTPVAVLFSVPLIPLAVTVAIVATSCSTSGWSSPGRWPGCCSRWP